MIQPKPSALPAQAAPTPAPASVPARRPSFTPAPNASGGYGLAQTTDGVDFKLYGT
ncbi:TIGR00266 family protein, partial [Pseudomonas congelans]